MARAQFDRKQVINQATQLFWQQGYHGASMQQVTQATGLKPGSIYLAFGNKEGLFKESLEEYANESMAYIKTTIEAASTVGEGICLIIESMIEESTNQDYCSCFLIKSQLELAANSEELHNFASRQLEKTEALYYEYLIQDMPAGLARSRATSLMLHIFGVRVYGYQHDSKDRIKQGLQEGLTWLPW